MSGAEPSSFVDADVIARLRKANAALREVINTQAVQIETLTGQVAALSAQLAAPAAADVRPAVGKMARVVEAAWTASPECAF